MLTDTLLIILKQNIMISYSKILDSDFLNGKIVKATAKDNSKELNEIFDTDDGARYNGEFAFGLNPYVNYTMCDTLFDEKINGSFHLTPGMALEESDNGNRSAIH